MSSRLFRTLPPLAPINIRQHTTERLRAGNDTAMPIRCYARVRLNIAGVTTECEFAVADNLVYDL